MRPPLRAVGDDHVDRPQVGALRDVEPSGTNGPDAGGRAVFAAGPPAGLSPWSRGRCAAPVPERRPCAAPLPSPVPECRWRHRWRPWRGGAPLPIPNREVKPRRGDDTAGDRGKVARRPTRRDPCPIGQGSLFSCLFVKKSLFLPKIIGYGEKHLFGEDWRRLGGAVPL